MNSLLRVSDSVLDVDALKHVGVLRSLALPRGDDASHVVGATPARGQGRGEHFDVLSRDSQLDLKVAESIPVFPVHFSLRSRGFTASQPIGARALARASASFSSVTP